MTNAKKIIALLVASTTALMYLLHKKAQRDTIDRFPWIDRKVGQKAYNRVFIRALKQEIDDETLKNTDEMDALFLQETWKIEAQ